MASKLEIDTGTRVVRRGVPGALRAHAFLSVAVVCVLIGGGLRFVPTSTAAPAGSNGTDQAGAASTACAAS
jgi:hypothetical protein